MNEQLPGTEEEEEGEMHLLDHLSELRTRLLSCFCVIALLACICYSGSGQLFELLSQPYFDAFPTEMLIGTGPAEAFLLKLKVSIFAGVILGSPMIFYQIWLFVAPGLYEHERKFVIPFVVVTSGLFMVGVWFCYALVLPFAFEFFSGQYSSIGVTPTIRISEHLSLVLKALFGFGVVFELPVLAFILGRLGVIDDQTLMGAGRYAIVFIFLISALLTPPDVLTQFLMAAPLLILYGVSILIVRYTGKKRLDEAPSTE